MDLARLDEMIATGRLIRNQWEGTDSEGKATACLFAAMYPGARSTDSCPASDMPQWLARLTPWIDDAGTSKHWPVITKRYANLAHRWHVLDAKGWRRAFLGTLKASLTEARKYAGSAEDSVDRVSNLIDKELGGEAVLLAEWDAAREYAWTKYYAAEAARAAEAAARAAAEAAARAAAEAAAAARAAREAAAEAAAEAAEAAEAAAEAARAAARAAAEAADRIIDGILDSLEAEIVAAEAHSTQG